MSPYCPRCLGVSLRGDARCPLDLQFLHRRSCPECGYEIFPRELYCAHCGGRCREPDEALLVPAEAGLLRVLGSLVLDYFTLSLLLATLCWSFAGVWILPMLPFAGIVYRAVGRSGGRQTFGQAVFHLMTINLSAGPADLSSALRRSVEELAALPRSLFARNSWRELEISTATLDIALA